MDLRGYLGVLRRRVLLIAMTVAAVLAAVAALTWQTTPVYESTARVFVSSAQTSTAEAYTGGLLSEQRVTSYAVLVQSRVLAQQVKETLGLDDDVDALTEHVSSKVIADTVVLELSVTDEDPERAQAIAQAYADQLVAMTRDIETPVNGDQPPIKATVIDPATVPEDPVQPKPLVNLVLGLVFGLVLGVALALLREMLDTTIKSADDVTAVTEAPLMGAIVLESSGSKGRLVTELDVHAPRVEAFRVLRTNIQFVDVDSSDNVFVVTSAVQEEGKTSTAVNLALSLSQAGIRTLLVDGDLRRPKIASTLGLDGATGVTTALVGKVGWREAVQRHALTDLDVLASGAVPPNAAELLQSRAMATLVEEVRTAYDVVVFDSPPLLPVTDAALLASLADGALVVIRHGRTTRDQLTSALDRLAQVDARTIGVVMNMVPGKKSDLGYSYRSYDPKPPKGRKPSKRKTPAGQRVRV